MRRTKILVLCQENQSVVDCMKDWYHVLKDETNGIKMEEWGANQHTLCYYGFCNIETYLFQGICLYFTRKHFF